MADITMTPAAIEIGTSYAPSGTVHTFITLSNVNVTGKIAIPEKVASVKFGTSSKITAATTITSAYAVIDPASVTIDQTAKKLMFNLIVQAKYNTPSISGDIVETKVFSAEAAIVLPSDMTSFTLANTFVPFIKTIAAASVVETASGSGVYLIQVPITLGEFTISASGVTNVKVPLAIE